MSEISFNKELSRILIKWRLFEISLTFESENNFRLQIFLRDEDVTEKFFLGFRNGVRNPKTDTFLMVPKMIDDYLNTMSRPILPKEETPKRWKPDLSIIDKYVTCNIS